MPEDVLLNFSVYHAEKNPSVRKAIVKLLDERLHQIEPFDERAERLIKKYPDNLTVSTVLLHVYKERELEFETIISLQKLVIKQCLGTGLISEALTFFKDYIEMLKKQGLDVCMRDFALGLSIMFLEDNKNAA